MKITMSQFKNGLLLQCARAPAGCEAYVGREGSVYHASDRLDGSGVTWIWNMRFIGGATEVPIREGDGFEFVVQGRAPTEKKTLNIGELRAQSPYVNGDTRVVLVTSDETLMSLLGELQITKCWPDTTDEHGDFHAGVSTFKIQVERKGRP